MFCVFRGTQADLKGAIEEELKSRGVERGVVAPARLEQAHKAVRDGFGRPAPTRADAIAVVVRDNLSESVDLDGGTPVVIHHDLSWSPVRWEQRMGRVIRASSRFTPPTAVIVPILDVSVDRRMWETLRGRDSLTNYVVNPDARRLLMESLPDSDPADELPGDE